MLSSPEIKAEVKFKQLKICILLVLKSRGLVLQGDYPTPGGNRVVNKAFNFYEEKMLELIKIAIRVFKLIYRLFI
jgi:hypothetical protein